MKWGASFLIVALLAILGGCAKSVWAPDSELDRVRFRDASHTYVTLYSVINVGSGNGAHSALLINGSERVLFDPAGSFEHSTIPERNDVLYGMNPAVLDFYVDFHSRQSYYTLEQKLAVPADVVEIILERAKAAGPVSQAGCTRSISAILKGLPGFEPIRSRFWPDNLAEDFAKIPGVATVEHRQTDSDDNTVVLRRWNPANAQ